MTEQIAWIETTKEMPDADELILIFIDEETSVGFFNGKHWVDLSYACEMPSDEPKYWARMPAGPGVE